MAGSSAGLRALASCLALAAGLASVHSALSAQTSSSSQGQHHHKAAAEQSGPPPELTQAEADIGKQDYAGAEPLLKKVVQADAANYVAWFDLGFVESELGRTEDAIAAYRKAAAAKPDIFEVNLNLGLMLAKVHRPDAEQFLRAATKLKPTANTDEGHARAWLGLAHLLEASQPDEAIEAYKQAALLRPKDAEIHLSAGLLLEKQSRAADAEQEYKQALAIDPASSDGLTGLANLYMRAHRFPEAEDVLRKLVALHPQDAGASMQLGRMLAADGKKDEAIAQLEAAQKLEPKDADLQLDLADLYTEAGKYDLAEPQYRALLASNPRDAEVHHALGKVLLKERKFPEAQQEFLIAVQIKPDFGGAYGDLAVAAEENQNYPLAIKAADARDKFLAPVPIGYFLRASAYDHLRDYKDAALNYHKFLEVSGGKFPDQEWQARHRLVAIEPKK